MRKTKIVCTIGPATESVEMLKKMINAGMNVARINFSHGGYEENKEKIENVKKAREELNMPVALMLDTKGPEIRTGVLETGNEKVTINEGNTFTFVNDEIIGNETKTSISYKNLYEDVKVGSMAMKIRAKATAMRIRTRMKRLVTVMNIPMDSLVRATVILMVTSLTAIIPTPGIWFGISVIFPRAKA